MSEVADEKIGDSRAEEWAALAQTLVAEFPLIAAGEVVENITRNRQAVQAFGLAEAEHLAIVEVMTRHQLMQLSGQASDNARQQPEQHLRRDRGSALGT
jgi:hypothetical protein